jgi:hypothetical protein
LNWREKKRKALGFVNKNHVAEEFFIYTKAIW